MARPSRKSVYERIEDKKLSIQETEELLAQLNNELQELYTERDNLQMAQLFEAMKTKGLDIEEALKLLHTSGSSNENNEDNEQDKPKKKNKKETIEEDINIVKE